MDTVTARPRLINSAGRSNERAQWQRGLGDDGRMPSTRGTATSGGEFPRCPLAAEALVARSASHGGCGTRSQHDGATLRRWPAVATRGAATGCSPIGSRAGPRPAIAERSEQDRPAHCRARRRTRPGRRVGTRNRQRRGKHPVELLKRAPVRATNLELSAGYEDEARRLLAEAALTGRLERRVLDLAEAAEKVGVGDVVVLHRGRVLLPGLRPAAGRGRRPRPPEGGVQSPAAQPWSPAFLLGTQNLVFRLRGSEFCVFAHPPDAMLSVLSGMGCAHRRSDAGRCGRSCPLPADVRAAVADGSCVALSLEGLSRPRVPRSRTCSVPNIVPLIKLGEGARTRSICSA